MNLGSSHCFAWLGLTSLSAFTTPCVERRVSKSIRGISSKTFLLFLRALLQHLWSSGLDHHRPEPGSSEQPLDIELPFRTISNSKIATTGQKKKPL